MKSKFIHFYDRHRFVASVAMIVFLFVFSSGGLVVVNGETLEPNDSHIISLYVDGQELYIPSRAKTVGEFLRNSDIQVGEFDSVEPDATHAILSDLFRVRVTRARPYMIRDGSKELSSLSAHTSARLIAESAGIDLKPADKVEFLPPSLDDSSVLGRVVEITRSKQVTLALYGVPQVVHTNSLTVGSLFSELAIVPAPDDELSPAVIEPVTDGMQIFVNRKGIRVATEEVVIEQATEYVQDDDLSLGSVVTRDPGAPGKRIVTYEIVTKNDAEVSRKEISSVIIEQPRTKIIARGRAAGQIGAEKQELMALAGISPEEYAAADYIIGRESGWCATKWQGQWGYCPSFYEEKYPGAESNKTLGYGLCQSTPAIKMASAGDDWRTNPVTQLKWCTSYARGRYGDWNKAYDFWINAHWW